MLSSDISDLMSDCDMPWWQRWLCQGVYFVVITAVFVWTVGAIAVGLACLAISQFLPAPWREAWLKPPAPEPDAVADCPSCQSPLAVGPAADDMQRGACPVCGRIAVRVYRRMTYGAFWSPWKAADA